MDTNSVSSNKITLKVSTPQGKEMALNKGEVLQAQVQEIGDDGLVTIVVKGKPIEAYTEVAVKPGQQLLLIVDDVRSGKTYLKVVTPELMGKIETTNISANLVEMGITAREENIGLARKLLQYNLPVNQSNLNELNKNASSLGGTNARNLEIAAFALSRGINGKNALESLAQFLASPGDTAKLLPVISRLLNALDVQSTNSSLENNTNAKAGTGLSSSIESARVNSQLNQVFTSLLNEESGNQMTASKNSLSSPSAGGSGSVSVNAGAVPGNSQVSQPINMNSQANATADKQVQAGTAEPDGAEASSSPKLNPSATSDTKLSNTPGRGGVPIGQSNGGSVKTINQAGNILIGASQPPDESAGSSHKADASADNKVKPELVLRDTVITTAVKGEEQSTGTKSTTNTTVSGDEPLAAQTIMAGDDEIIERLMGRENNSAQKIAGPESLLTRESLKQELVKLLDTIRSLMDIDLKAAPDKIAGQLRTASSAEKDIIRALSLLVDMAKDQDMAAKIPELKEFSLSLDKLEKEITGQQLFNLGSRNVADNMSNFYYFAFPVKIDQEYSLCQLKINKDGRKSLKDVDKLSFVVSLNTTQLGVVLFHINWQKTGNLQLQGVAENQASCNFLNHNIGALVSKLEELGYKVKNLGVKVSNSAEEMRVRPVLQEVGERLRPLGIDVTV